MSCLPVESMEKERDINSIDGFDAIIGILMLTDRDEIENSSSGATFESENPSPLQDKLIRLVEVGLPFIYFPLCLSKIIHQMFFFPTPVHVLVIFWRRPLAI